MASEHEHIWTRFEYHQPRPYQERFCPCGEIERCYHEGDWERSGPSIEQQLAQAREENGHLRQALGDIHATLTNNNTEIALLKVLNAAMRALLEEVGGWKFAVSAHDLTRYNDLIARVRAFLAQHKEQSDG